MYLIYFAMKTWHNIKDVTYCIAEMFDQMKNRNNHYFNCGDTIVLTNLLLSKEVQCYCLQLVMAKLFVNSHVSRLKTDYFLLNHTF